MGFNFGGLNDVFEDFNRAPIKPGTYLVAVKELDFYDKPEGGKDGKGSLSFKAQFIVNLNPDALEFGWQAGDNTMPFYTYLYIGIPVYDADGNLYDWKPNPKIRGGMFENTATFLRAVGVRGNDPEFNPHDHINKQVIANIVEIEDDYTAQREGLAEGEGVPMKNDIRYFRTYTKDGEPYPRINVSGAEFSAPGSSDAF